MGKNQTLEVRIDSEAKAAAQARAEAQGYNLSKFYSIGCTLMINFGTLTSHINFAAIKGAAGGRTTRICGNHFLWTNVH